MTGTASSGARARFVRADDAGAQAAGDALRAGGVVVLPTDTVYGLAARPDDPDAVQMVFEAKGRPEGMHLPVLAASLEQVRALGIELTSAARTLAERWWPGPLTLAFGFAPGGTRPGWLDGRDEVAVRIPDHDFLRGLLATTGVLLVTSANPHGAPTPLEAADVETSLGRTVGVIVDGGELSEVPSTLVNVRSAQPVVEREGAIAKDEIARALAAMS
jgi:L-threonylcarbamoyladenylate synthase